jgi:very-short-patch-repair endonuclease
MGDYIADFACLGARLVVELDGDTHGSDQRQSQDASRTGTIERHGFRVIRFWNDEVFTNTDGVIETIWNACESSR